MSEVKTEVEEDPLFMEEGAVVPGVNLYTGNTRTSLPTFGFTYRPPHKIRMNGTLSRQSRSIIANVLSYMEMEKCSTNFLLPPKKAMERTRMATGTGRTALRYIAKDSKNIKKNLQQDFRHTAAKKSRIAQLTSPEVYDTGACRSLIFKTIVESERPADNQMLHAKLVEAKLFKAGRSSMGRFMKNMGFTVKRMRYLIRKGKESPRTMVVEKHDLQYQKYVYLRDLRKYRAEGRPIIFTAITKLARAHCKGGEPSKEAGQMLKVTKGMFNDIQAELSTEQWRAVLLDAGDENGFVTSAFDMWRCIKKLGSNLYDEGANYKRYVKWIRGNLLSHIPKGAAVVLDHETLYDKHAEPIPTQSAAKGDMTDWLTKNGIDYPPEAPKVELYELIRRNKRDHSKFEIDSILEEAGHPVLRIPKHYTELNPMMIMLKEVKEWIKGQAPTANPRFVDIAKLTVAKMLTTPTELWTSKVHKCQALADEYYSYQGLIEERTAKSISASSGCFDSESEEEQEDPNSDEDTEVSSCAESEDDNEDNEVGLLDKNPDTWVSATPSVFMAGDDFTPSSAPERKSKKGYRETSSAKRRKSSDDGSLPDSDGCELDGLVMVKNEQQ